ncbi:hypothetical protein, partial [Xanthomonas hortorum]|uniref:hypothetical protein n=1 Tax=Xanthomonas hortorum TaxID=56454 RepID=UPI001E49ABF1
GGQGPVERVGVRGCGQCARRDRPMRSCSAPVDPSNGIAIAEIAPVSNEGECDHHVVAIDKAFERFC